MKKVFGATVIAMFLGVAPLDARQGGNFGLGVQVGEPSGLAAKLWFNRENALDMLLGYSARHDWVFAKADYLWHGYGLVPVPRGELGFFIGPGAMVVLSDSPGLGAEFALGVTYIFPTFPFDVFLQLAPGVWLFPDTEANINVGIGAHFYF